ncbi:serine/threonine protein kinase [Pseudomonadota bacterium]
MSSVANLTKLGRYEISGVIGKGAMGVVYKGKDPSIDRTVAIKTIHPFHLESENGAELLERFKREAQAAGQCQHPNIVTIFEFDHDQGIPFIAMEYIKGNELRQIQKKPDLLDDSHKLKFVSQVLEALRYAHNRDILHRDIKPANIILLEGGSVKLTDFGIARLSGSDITQTGFIVGTPSYMSPEQIRGERLDQRSDLFSVGVVLYEILSGKKPFAEEDATATIHAVLHKEPPSPCEINPRLSKAIEPLVKQSLHKDREQRFDNASEFIDAINEACQISLRDDNVEATEVLALPITVVLPTVKASTKLSPIAQPTNETGQTWHPSVLQKIEENLTSYIGPLAKRITTQTSLKASSLNELLETLSMQIPEGNERSEFLSRFNFSRVESEPIGVSQSNVSMPTGTSEISSSGITQGEFNHIEQSLTFYVGPLARILIKQNSSKARSREELCSLLALHISDPDDKAEFLTKLNR